MKLRKFCLQKTMIEKKKLLTMRLKKKDIHNPKLENFEKLKFNNKHNF